MAFMRTKYLNIAAIACVCVYLVAAGSVAVRLASRAAANEVLAGKEFAEIVDRASAAAILGFMDAPFREAVRDGIENSRTLAAAIVTGPEGPEYAVERTSGHLMPGNGAPRFASAFGAREAPLFSPLRFEGIRNATISAQALIITEADVFAVLRDALFAVLAGLLIALVFLAVPGSKAQATAPAEENLHDRSRAGEPSGLDKAGRPEAAPVAAPIVDEAFDIPDLSVEVSAEVTEDLPPVKAGMEERPRSPVGLYSPRSGLGWEEYAHDRIESELHRCASFEQDLVFLVMAPSARTAGIQSSISDVAREIVGFFGFKDLAFERGDSGVSLILPNVDLDRGLRMSDEFRDALRDEGGVLAGIDLRIGLTSRSGRLVDTDRLIMEAERALEKALEEDDSPIVAFKPDPERYRAFVAEQN
ncbi:MAG: hypothetical protein A2413_20965 [Treponema sp. RIFOXYC1_FULL_61_9]|nr:MAG: hypothetical protein A2413_20965 [Treponema sp. RIFOXYC1_FULL_61_9]